MNVGDHTYFDSGQYFLNTWCHLKALTPHSCHKNIERDTAHTIVSWRNPKQWQIDHGAYFVATGGTGSCHDDSPSATSDDRDSDRVGIMSATRITLQWRHNERDCVANHQPHDCLLNRLFRRRSKKTSKHRVTGFCVGNSPVIGEFPAQRASNAGNVSIWWRHHESHSSL